MTRTRVLQWWAKAESIKDESQFALKLRYSAMAYLLVNRNQSGVERNFSRYKTYASPTRNRLNPQTTFNEVLINAMKKNGTLFHILREKPKKKSRSDETQEERKIRHGYKKMNTISRICIL